MKRVPVVALLSALLMAPGVGLAQTEDHSRHAGSASGGVGTVSFETSCSAGREGRRSTTRWRSCTRSGSPKRVPASRSVLKTDPACAMRVLGDRADALGQSVRRPADRRRRLRQARPRSTRDKRPDRRRRARRATSTPSPGCSRAPTRARSARACSPTRSATGAVAAAEPERHRGAESSGRSRSIRPRCRPTSRSRRTCSAAEILEPLYKKMPNHPGLAHYIIHTYDVPALADKALPRRARLCRHRAGSAARAPHAVAHRSRASGCGRNRSPPTSSPRRRRRRPAASAKRCTPSTIRPTRTCRWRRTQQAKAALDHAADGGAAAPAAVRRRRRRRTASRSRPFPRATRWSACQWAERDGAHTAACAEHAVHRGDHALRARRSARRAPASRPTPPPTSRRLGAIHDSRARD